jgi:hypothetical protein
MPFGILMSEKRQAAVWDQGGKNIAAEKGRDTPQNFPQSA